MAIYLMKPKPLKPKRCKVCKELFQPLRSLQQVCGIECSKTHANALRAKKERAEHREAKVKIKRARDWKAEAQTEFNKFVRLRDDKLPCVSCGRTEDLIENTYGGKWDCGHYLSRGSHPELAFEELNAHKQCKKCNGGAGKYAKKNHTVTESYREELIKRIGLDKVEFLEGPHEPLHFDIEDFKNLKAKYKAKQKTFVNRGSD